MFFLTFFQTGRKKQVLALCLAISSVATVTEASRHPSSAPRSFKAFLEAKIRRICDEVVDLKQEVEDCCNKAGSLFITRTRLFRSIHSIFFLFQLKCINF